MGFYYFSYIYLFIVELFIRIDGLPDIISKVLLNHGLIFTSFFFSAIYSAKIVNFLIKDKFYSKIFLYLYLFYPYLLGHGFFNTTDTPFLFSWIITTYISIKIFIKIYKDINVSLLNILLLSFFTAFLLSIRISGILIFLQYLIFTIVVLNYSNDSFYKSIVIR